MSDKPIITLPYSVVTVNQDSIFNPPNAAVVAGIGNKKLKLDSAGKTINFTKTLPYEFKINFSSGSTEIKAAHLNASNQPTISSKITSWLYSSDNKLLFSADKYIIEGA